MLRSRGLGCDAILKIGLIVSYGSTIAPDSWLHVRSILEEIDFVDGRQGHLRHYPILRGTTSPALMEQTNGGNISIRSVPTVSIRGGITSVIDQYRTEGVRIGF